MSLQQLYDGARPIPKELEFINKYTWLGINQVLPVKYLDVNDVMSQPNNALKNYIIKNEAVLLFPNIINGVIVDMYVRPLYTKSAPLKLGDTLFPYNIGCLNPDFKYGEPIVLVEGLADAAALKLMIKDLNIVVMQSSSLSNSQIDFISQITNKIIVIPDNDDAGKTGATKMWYRFKERGVNMVSLGQFRYFKDTGDFLDKVIYYYKSANDHTLLDEINLAWQYYKVAIESELKSMK